MKYYQDEVCQSKAAPLTFGFVGMTNNKTTPTKKRCICYLQGLHLQKRKKKKKKKLASPQFRKHGLVSPTPVRLFLIKLL